MSGLRPSRLAPSHLLGTGGVTGQGAIPLLNLILGYPGTCPNEPTLVISINDDSGSMLGGSDSTGLRYTEFEIVIDRVGRRCRCDRELVAILHMNRPTSADRPPLPLNRRVKADIKGGLTIPTDGDGASAMGATLRRAAQIASAYPTHRVVLAAFSDFELIDNMNQLTAELAAFPGEVHAIVMRSQPPQQLLDEDAITVTHVPAGAAPGAVASALFAALTAYRPGCRPATTDAAKRHQ